MSSPSKVLLIGPNNWRQAIASRVEPNIKCEHANSTLAPIDDLNAFDLVLIHVDVVHDASACRLVEKQFVGEAESSISSKLAVIDPQDHSQPPDELPEKWKFFPLPTDLVDEDVLSHLFYFIRERRSTTPPNPMVPASSVRRLATLFCYWVDRSKIPEGREPEGLDVPRHNDQMQEVKNILQELGDFDPNTAGATEGEANLRIVTEIVTTTLELQRQRVKRHTKRCQVNFAVGDKDAKIKACAPVATALVLTLLNTNDNDNDNLRPWLLRDTDSHEVVLVAPHRVVFDTELLWRFDFTEDSFKAALESLLGDLGQIEWGETTVLRLSAT